jgi:AraC-like DNA-binding protein
MSSTMPPGMEKLMGRIRQPGDYFADVRNSLTLWPERILCFTRKSQAQMDAQSLERHHHHRYVLVIPWIGEGAVYVDDRQFTLIPAQALLIFPFQFHHGFRLHQSKAVWQFITFEMKNGEALEALRLHPLRRFEAGDLVLLSTFAEAWIHPKRKDELAYWLALFIIRMLGAPQLAAIRSRTNNSSPLLRRINQACMPHLDRPFGLKDLSSRLSLSESYLRTRFRNETGISLGKHLRRLRLQKAIGLLVQSDLTVTQIAERCGFESVFAFSRSFRRFTNITARDYRLRFRKSQ